MGRIAQDTGAAADAGRVRYERLLLEDGTGSEPRAITFHPALTVVTGHGAGGQADNRAADQRHTAGQNSGCRAQDSAPLRARSSGALSI